MSYRMIRTGAAATAVAVLVAVGARSLLAAAGAEVRHSSPAPCRQPRLPGAPMSARRCLARWLLHVPRQRGTGRRNGPRPRPAVRFPSRASAVRAQSCRRHAAVHGQGAVRPRPRRHLCVPAGAAERLPPSTRFHCWRNRLPQREATEEWDGDQERTERFYEHCALPARVLCEHSADRYAVVRIPLAWFDRRIDSQSQRDRYDAFRAARAIAS